MTHEGFIAFKRMFELCRDKGQIYFVPDALGLSEDDLSELTLAGIIENAEDINSEINFDIDAAKRFLNQH